MDSVNPMRVEPLLKQSRSLMQSWILMVRLLTLILIIALLTVHLRSVRVFRWEQSVSGGLLVTYGLGTLGLAMAAGLQHAGARAFEAYICATGSLLLALNAAAIYRRWRQANQLTRVVAELLTALGVPLRRQVLVKVSLSAAAATALMVDLALAALIST